MITMGAHSYCATNDITCSDLVNLTIGKYCSIASGLLINSGQHPIVEHPEAVSQYPFYEQTHEEYWICKMGGFVDIGNDVWVGQNVTILEGVTIGDGAIIASCSVVTKDVPCYGVMAGNPARLKKYRFLNDTINKLEQIKWWDFDDEKLKKAIPYMKNIGTFLNNYS